MYDVVIVGGGPAGLSAALILGRCRRSVVVCDSGRPRNAASHAMHAFVTRDGIDPAEFLRLSREELRHYGVEMRSTTVLEATRTECGFEVVLVGGERLESRKLLLATGVVDKVPKIEGIEALYGRSVFHCPYCDGWEVREQPLAVYGSGRSGLEMALSLKTWSDDIVLCTDGPSRLRRPERDKLVRYGVGLRTERIARLEGTDGRLERIVLESGDALERRAMFFSTRPEQHSDLAVRLGCQFTPKRCIQVNKLDMSSVAGLYVTGDASSEVKLVIIAAAQGAKAAFAINRALQDEDFEAHVPCEAPSRD